MRALREPPDFGEDAAAELVAWLQRHLDEHGDLLPSAQVAAYMVDADLPAGALPERFRRALDARERRR